MIFGHGRKKLVEFCCLVEKRLCLKRIRVYNTGGREVGVGTLLLVNNKNSVIANKVLSYFYSLSSKFEICVTLFRAK